MAIIPDHIEDFHGHFYDFGSTGNLAAAASSELIFDNTIGYNHIGFRLIVPPGGEVTFQATYDNSKYFDIKLRNDDCDYVSSATSDSGFRGVISAYRKIKFLVSSPGSTTGTIIGRTTMVIPPDTDQAASLADTNERDSNHQIEVRDTLKRLLTANIINIKHLEQITGHEFSESESEIREYL